jgi:regulatory protein YycH of two-component signal transduction system YycFG
VIVKEKIKTLILTILVVTSLLLSLGIWSATPQYESIDDSPQFASNVAITDPSFERKIGDVINPRAVLLHLGEGKHTSVFPGQSGYQEGMELLKSASFFGIKIDVKLNDQDWKKIVEGEAVQYEFDAVIPLTLLNDADLIRFTSRLEPFIKAKSIYLYKEDGGDIRTVFVENADTIYTADVVVPMEPFSRLLNAHKNAPAFALYGNSVNRNFYLPAERLRVHTYSIDVSPGIATERLVDSYFLDKALTRRVVERDGSEIITDGSRLVRVGKADKRIEFRNLSIERAPVNQLDEDLSIVKALAFANSHGGFVGQVGLHQVRTLREGDAAGRVFEFRPTVAGFPVVGELSSVVVQVIDNDVAAMRRSSYMAGARPMRGQEQELLSGSDIMNLVEKNALLKPNRVTDVYLAYLMGEVRGQWAELRPVFVVEQEADFREGIFDAVTGELLQSEEGMLRGLE